MPARSQFADADEGGTSRIGGYSLDSDDEDGEVADANKSRYKEQDEDMYVKLDGGMCPPPPTHTHIHTHCSSAGWRCCMMS